MVKYIWTISIIVGLTALLLVAKEFGPLTQTQAGTGNVVVSFSHTAQDVGAIDIYIDDTLVIEDLQVTDPNLNLQIAPGNHLIDVFPAGENVVLIKTTELAFEADHSYHLTLDGLQADWSVELSAIDDTAE